MEQFQHKFSRHDELVVVICTYNNAPLLRRTLDTLERQVEAERLWSTLVINNNSTDETAAVVEEYIARRRIPGLRLITESKQGLAFARRRAVSETASPWLAFVDDDCLLENDWVREALRFIQAHPDIGGLGGRIHVRWEGEPEPVIRRFATSYAAQDYGTTAQLVTEESAVRHLVGAGLILRREALQRCGWLETGVFTGRKGKRLMAGEDTEIVFRIRNAGYALWYAPSLKMQHFITQRRMTLDYLCRMQRGFGQSRPITRDMRFNQVPSFNRRCRIFARHLVVFIRLLKSVVCDHWLSRKALSEDQRVGLHFELGQLEGAWFYLRKGFPR